MHIKTNASPYSILYSTAVVATSFPAVVPVTTYTLSNSGGILGVPNATQSNDVYNYAHLIFFGKGVSGTFSAKVILWTRFCTDLTSDASRASNDIWVPETVLNLSGTLGTPTGISGQPIDNTNYFATTLSLTGTANTNYSLSNSTDGTLASVSFDTMGAQRIQVLLSNGVSTEVNAAYRLF